MKNFRTAYQDEFLVRTSPQFLEDVFHWVRPILRPSHRAGYEIGRVFLILDEVLSNVYRHGYGRAGGQLIGVRLRVEGDRCDIIVRDLARHFDGAWHAKRSALPAPESASPGGRGLVIMQRIVESIVHRVPPEGGNELHLVMRMLLRPGVATSAPDVMNETARSTEEDDGVVENR